MFSVIQDFCKLAWDYVAKGVNPKLYATVSEKIGISPQDLQHIVEGLVSLLVEACKLKISNEKFVENLKNFGFNTQQCHVLNSFYSSKRVDMNHALLDSSIKLPMFKDLKWNINMRLRTRALPDHITPHVIINLERENVEDKSLILQTDPGNLVHITHTLEKALKEATSQHANRVQRRFNAT